MALRDTVLDRLWDALLETDSAVAGGAPALRMQIEATATITVTAANTMAATAAERLADATVQTNSALAGGVPAVHVRTV